jgi:CRP-like cAMP-binding protein
MGRVERGGVLGEMELFDRGPRPATATAVVVPETRLAAWEYSDLHEFLSGQPEAGVKVMRALLARMASRVRATSEALQLLLRAVGRE